MTLNCQEQSQCVGIELDLLKIDKNVKTTQSNNREVLETTILMQNTQNAAPSVGIQTQTDRRNQSPVVSTVRMRFPSVIMLISLIQIALYVFDSLHRENGNFSLSAQILLFTKEDKVEVWRYITYMFVHKDKFHLGLNIFYQLFFGVPLEIAHGWWRITIIYIAGVFSGSLCFLVIPNCKTLAGASAGVYSIIGAEFSRLILNWKQTEYRIIRIIILVLYVLINIFISMCIPQNEYNTNYGLFTCTLVTEINESTIIHFCGFVIGTITAIVFLRKS